MEESITQIFLLKSSLVPPVGVEPTTRLLSIGYEPTAITTSAHGGI
jgi:hypothetical protein